MAIKILWLVEHGCGDDEVHDLSGKRPSERAGYARWLRGKDCSACWRRTRGNDLANRQRVLVGRAPCRGSHGRPHVGETSGDV